MVEFRLAAAFGDHMVLQQGKPLTFWGHGRPHETVVLEWITRDGIVCVEACADANGSWRLHVAEQRAGGPYQLVFRATERIELADVWVGEVWLASGQSNMEWTVGKSAFVDQEVALATEPRLRWLFVERRAEHEPTSEARCEWRLVTPESVPAMTAIGYAFARDLCSRLDVAVGIIDASWGGTPVEAWASADALREVMDLERELAAWASEERELETIRQAYSELLLRWERRYLVRDDANRGEAAGWHLVEPAWDDPSMSLPTLWQSHGMAFNGAVWFRRELELAADFAGPATLELGRIDDFDHTYVNGTLVGACPQGTPLSCDIPRSYAVPSALLKAGRNVITVRVFDQVGEGGFLDSAHSLCFRSAAGERYELSGPWQYRVEREAPLVPASVWAEFPRAPRVLRPQDRPSALYNGMIAPLCGLGVRGVIWYQGEANVAEHQHYLARFGALIRDWQRRLAGESPLALPFLFVQLSSFRESGQWAYLREAQALALELPSTGMVVTLDIGDPEDIHPRNKREVGRRLARLALHTVHGLDVGPVRGPVPTSIHFGRGEAQVEYGEQALATTDGASEILGFEVEAPDGVRYPASARLVGNRAQITLPFVAAPRRLYYAFSDAPEVNLTNAAGLPAEPFRFPVA